LGTFWVFCGKAIADFSSMAGLRLFLDDQSLRQSLQVEGLGVSMEGSYFGSIRESRKGLVRMGSHVLSLLVEDKPGLLTRVAGLFARRGFNIESLAVGKTEIPGLSRITVVVDVEDLPLEQVTKQLNKLVNVLKIVELEPDQSVAREHMLIKVRVDNSTRSQILEATNLFRARVVDVVTDALVIEVTGDTAKVRALLKVLEPYGIKEIAQSGLLAIGRGSKSISDRINKNN
jgi:acetolactate synthase-1/3 small subunit